jgi:hypothetical protein
VAQTVSEIRRGGGEIPVLAVLANRGSERVNRPDR